MAEERKDAAVAGSGAKRIKALFSSFIWKEKEHQTKENSQTDLECTESKPTCMNKGTDEKDSGSCAKTEAPSRQSFRPLNQDDFFARVETFTFLQAFGWFAKPTDLSPLHCARYGWENIDTDCLKCVSCRQIMCGGLPPMWETESYSQAYCKLKESIKTSHSKICPWPASPSPESFLHISLDNTKSAVNDFNSRVDTMYPLGFSIPSIDCSPISHEKSFILDEVKSVLLESVAERNECALNDEEIPVWHNVCLLAVFGWKKSHSEQTGCPVLVCQYCRRHAGLWNFTSLKDASSESRDITSSESRDITSSARPEAEGEPPAKRIKDIAQSSFNPATEHRAWCPWVLTATHQLVHIQPNTNESTDSNNELVPDLVWQQLLIIILKKTNPDVYGPLPPVINKTTTPHSQAWKAVRRILNIWQSKETVPPAAETSLKPSQDSAQSE